MVVIPAQAGIQEGRMPSPLQ